MVPASKAGDRARYSAQLLKAIDWALSPAKDERPQSVAELRNALPIASQSVEDATTIVIPQPAAAPAAAPTTPVPRMLDGEALARIAGALAQHIGPIASQLVRSQARKSTSLAELVRKLAGEIPDDKARAAFVRTHAVEERFAAAAAAPAAAPSRPQPSEPGPGLPLDAAALARAESALAQHVGAVARVLVRRAAAKARSESELYHLLADEVEDPVERKAFVRKGLSISGKTVPKA